MPRQYSGGGQVPRGGGAASIPTSTPPVRTFREPVGALRNLPAFVAMVWRTSRLLTLSSLILRLFRALVPIVTLYIGKLIIDEVVALVQRPDNPVTLGDWVASGLLDRLALLLLAEFALAVLADVLGRWCRSSTASCRSGSPTIRACG